MISKFKIIKSFLEKKAHDFSSLQCDMPEELSEEIFTWGLKNIPDELLAGDGRQPKDDIHVTLKYGLHEHDPIEVRSLLYEFGSVDVTLGNVSAFENDIDVIKIEINSPDLHKLNNLITNNFSHTDTYSEYIPHITVAYVKSGIGKKYHGRKDFFGRKIKLNTVTFSGNDNRKTELFLN